MASLNTFTAFVIFGVIFSRYLAETANNEKAKYAKIYDERPLIIMTDQKPKAEAPKILNRKTETPGRNNRRRNSAEAKDAIGNLAAEAKKGTEKRRKKNSQVEGLLANSAVLREIVHCNFYFAGIEIQSAGESDANELAQILLKKIEKFAEKATDHSVMHRIKLNLAFIKMSLEMHFNDYSEFFEGVAEKTVAETGEFFKDFSANGTTDNLDLESVKPQLLYCFFFSCFYRNLMLNTKLSNTKENMQLLNWLYSLEKAMDGQMSEIIAKQNPPNFPFQNPKKATNE